MKNITTYKLLLAKHNTYIIQSILLIFTGVVVTDDNRRHLKELTEKGKQGDNHS